MQFSWTWLKIFPEERFLFFVEVSAFSAFMDAHFVQPSTSLVVYLIFTRKDFGFPINLLQKIQYTLRDSRAIFFLQLPWLACSTEALSHSQNDVYFSGAVVKSWWWWRWYTFWWKAISGISSKSILLSSNKMLHYIFFFGYTVNVHKKGSRFFSEEPLPRWLIIYLISQMYKVNNAFSTENVCTFWRNKLRIKHEFPGIVYIGNVMSSILVGKAGRWRRSRILSPVKSYVLCGT